MRDKNDRKEIAKKETSFWRYDIGASIVNMGNKINYLDTGNGDFLPMQLALGTMWTYNKDVNTNKSNARLRFKKLKENKELLILIIPGALWFLIFAFRFPNYFIYFNLMLIYFHLFQFSFHLFVSLLFISQFKFLFRTDDTDQMILILETILEHKVAFLLLVFEFFRSFPHNR